MTKKRTVTSVLSALMIGVLWIAVSAPASARPELLKATGKVNCNQTGVRVKGDLEKPGVDGIVDITIFLTPPHGGDVVTIETSIDVEGQQPDGKFTATFRQENEGLCGWFDVTGEATLRGFNTIPINIVIPDDGQIDCCSGVLGDFVWEDLDRDGVQDAGEPGIGGVTVVLRRLNGGRQETVTAADGSYLFTDLCPGRYTVNVRERTLPPGLVPTQPNVGDDTLDSDGPLDGGPVDAQVEEPECENLTIDFGYVREMRCTGVIGDFVWFDENGDGIQDRDEPGKEGVEVCLSDADGNEIECVLTDADGFYLFDELCAGDYSVEVDEDSLPGDTGPTLINVGGDRDVDSNPNPSEVTLDGDDDEDLSIDFGCALCQECDGGVTDLSFEYIGDDTALVEVVDGGDTLFAEVLDPGDVFSVSSGDPDDKLPDFDMLVDGELSVESLHMSCSQPIGPGLIFGDFRVVAGRSKNGGLMCPLVPCDAKSAGLEISGDKLTWKIENVGDGDITIESIEISWPMSNGDIVEVKLNGTISDGDFPPPSAVIDSFVGDLEDRQIEAGKDEELEFKFDNDADTSRDEYSITVNFAEGCSVTYVPGQEPFTCEKPIDEIVMIWDGGQTVDVKAWKGAPGSELLADVSGIAVGAELAVNGYAGSPNDVTWELFSNATGDFLGESQFHLSCSDSEMNGEEDCGKREGNGKGNDAGLINDWLLEGMSDAKGQFDCTP